MVPLNSPGSKRENLIRWPMIAVLLASCAFVLWRCSGRLPVEHDLSNATFQLLTQDSQLVIFPQHYRDTILLVAFIYTFCPDICPLTTTRMQQIQKQLPDSLPVRFLLISLDPRRDRPARLRDFARLHQLSPKHWTLLTGNYATMDSLLQRMEIFAIRSPLRKLPDGSEYYFINHSDVLCLFDGTGRERQRYQGTTAEISEVIADINALLQFPQ